MLQVLVCPLHLALVPGPGGGRGPVPRPLPRPRPRHVGLDLGHDVLGALHRHREPPQVWDLDLLLHLLRMEVLLMLLLVLGVSSQGVVVVEALEAGAGGELLLLLLLPRLLQRGEPVSGHLGMERG